MNRIAVVRVRGAARASEPVHRTMNLLRIQQVNHCAIIQDTPHYLGMLQKAKDWITWGEINQKELEKLLTKRGRLAGDKKLTDEYVKKNTKYETIAKFAEAILQGKAELKDLPGLKLFFRLSPPKGGYEGVKKQYANKGALGYRGVAMNSLLERMLR